VQAQAKRGTGLLPACLPVPNTLASGQGVNGDSGEYQSITQASRWKGGHVNQERSFSRQGCSF